MSLSDKQMLSVMAYVDGELEGEELENVIALIESDAEARELHASLRAIGDGVRSSFDVKDIDIGDVVIQKLRPNDLDKARIRRTARTRFAVVGASLVALAAGVLFYMRDANNTGTTGQTPHTQPSGESLLASASTTGVQVDFVDTPSAVSVFYLPASTQGAEGTTNEVAPSVVVWVADDETTPPKEPETTP
jgi:hypothetical protein